MKARFAAWLEMLGNQFWLLPACLVALGLALGEGAVQLESAVASDPAASPLGGWLYRGGEAGARALLGAIASSMIGVAGTTFSITVAALSLASGQMGPRLLRNFVRDRGNQAALGLFLGTFAYSLILLRTVRDVDEAEFVPHLGVTGAMVLAVVCVATLVWFVHHIALSINVETVIAAVDRDLASAIDTLTSTEPPSGGFAGMEAAAALRLERGGYIQTLDAASLAGWAAEHGVVIRMRARPGDYVPAGAPVADIRPAHPGAAEAVSRALDFGPSQIAVQDLEFFVRQLVEVALRALSAGINDPFTAAAVLNRMGGSLCRLSSRHLPSGVVVRDGRVVLALSVTTYGGLCDAMFHAIRQHAADSAFTLVRLLDVLARVGEVERSAGRLAELRRHADLALVVGQALADPAGREAVEARHRAFRAVAGGAVAA